jgi:hypothetical protein
MLCEQYGNILCLGVTRLYRTDACIHVGINEALCQCKGDLPPDFFYPFNYLCSSIGLGRLSIRQLEKWAALAILLPLALRAAARSPAAMAYLDLVSQGWTD